MKVVFEEKNLSLNSLNKEKTNNTVDFMEYFHLFNKTNNYVLFYNNNHIHTSEILSHGLNLFKKTWLSFGDYVKKHYNQHSLIIVQHSCCYFLPFLIFNKSDDIQKNILKNFLLMFSPSYVKFNVSLDNIHVRKSVCLNKNKIIVYKSNENNISQLESDFIENFITEYHDQKRSSRGRPPLFIQECKNILLRREIYFDIYLLSSIEYQKVKHSFDIIKSYCYHSFT